MPNSKRGHTIRHMASRCAAIPGLMHARRDVARAQGELARVVALAQEAGGLVPRTEKDHHPDAMANLWFMRAAHALAAAAKHDKVPGEFFAEKLVPLCKRIVQQFISEGGIDGVRMDDGAMLTGGIAVTETLRVNALWYSSLEMTAQALHRGVGGSKDGATHFERLSGRFRRSFPKAYWCDKHKCLCSAASQAAGDGNHGEWPEPDQLLLTVLPASPLPRTKQRQILQRITEKSLGKVGVLWNHPVHGLVESPLHRAWLAQGIAGDEGDSRRKAAEMINPLVALWPTARLTGIYAFYHDDVPAAGQAKPDPLSTAEVLGGLEQLTGQDPWDRP